VIVVCVAMVMASFLLWRANHANPVEADETVSQPPAFARWRWRMILATVVDWGKLLQAAYVSAVFGIGVVLIGGLAVVASLRSRTVAARIEAAPLPSTSSPAPACWPSPAPSRSHLHHGQQVSDSDQQPDTGRPRPVPRCSTCCGSASTTVRSARSQNALGRDRRAPKSTEDL